MSMTKADYLALPLGDEVSIIPVILSHVRVNKRNVDVKKVTFKADGTRQAIFIDEGQVEYTGSGSDKADAIAAAAVEVPDA